jgi:autotransporter translocation and assembly factor TamB
MPRLRSVLIALLVFLLVGSFTVWRLVQSDFFWRWAGGMMVSEVQKQINGTLTVNEIQGNPITGLLFQGVTVTSPEGEIFRLKSLEVRLSLWSVVKLKPVIGKLALVEPRLNLTQDASGQWNISRLVLPREKPAEGGVALPLRSLSFRQILMVDGEVNLSQAGKETRYHNLDLNLSVTLDHPFTAEQTVKLSQAEAAVTTPQGRFALHTRLTYGKNRLDLRALTLEGEQERYLTLAGKADLAAKTGAIQFLGELGPVKGQTISSLWSKWPGVWDVSGNLKIKGTLARVHLDLEGKIHQAPYTIKGSLEEKAGKWLYEAALDLVGLKPELLAAFDKAWAEKGKEVSPLSLRVRAQGVGLAWPPEHFTYSLEGEPFTYAAARVEKLKVKAEGTAQKQQVEATLQGNFGSASLTGQGSFFTAPGGEVKLQAKSFRPDLLGLGAPEGTTLDAKLAASFSLPDFRNIDRLKVTGEVEASGKVGEHPLREFKGRLTWQKPNLTIPQLRIHLGNMVAELKGGLAGEGLDFTFTGRSTAQGDWPIPAGVKGQLTWEGGLKRKLSDPDLSLKAQGRALAYEQYSIQNFSLTAKGTGWLPSSGYFDFQGKKLKTPAGTFAQASLKGETAGQRWTFKLNAFSPKTPQVELAGSADLRGQPIEITLDRCRFQVKNVSGQNRGPIRLRFLPGFELEPATLAINQGSITLEGRLQETAVAGRLAAQDLPLELSGVEDLSGKLHAKMSLEGSAASPNLQGEIRVEPGQWRSLKFDSIKTALSYRDNSVNLNGTLAERTSGARMQWEGRLPLILSLSPWRYVLPDEDLSFRLRGERVNLSMLTAFTGEVEEAEAPITVATEVKGRWSKPQVSGQVKWGRGYITARQTGAKYGLQPGSINLQGDRLSLPQLTLKSDGTATLRADVKLAGFQPAEMKARVQFDHFKVLDKLRSEAYLNGQVSADGPWKALAVVGRLTIPEASLNPQLFKLGGGEINPDIVLVRQQKKVQKEKPKPVEPDFMKDMRVAVTVDARDNVWVRDKHADVELSVALRAQKRPGESLVVAGGIRSLRGNLDIQGRTFKLVRGIVDLPPTPGQEPYIEARAVHETYDVTIIVDVTGTPKNPHLELSSEPSLPKSEILSYLVFGRPTSALSQEEFSASNLAAGALGGLTAQKIQEILGPDFPLLGDVTLKTGKTMGIVKPLAKGVTLSFGRGGTEVGKESGYQARLEYRVNRNVTIEAQTGTNPGADVFFNYDF